MAPPYLPEMKRGRRPYDYDPGEAQGHASQDKMAPVVAPPPSSHRGGSMLMNGWQEAAMDLSKPGEMGLDEGGGNLGHHQGQIGRASC